MSDVLANEGIIFDQITHGLKRWLIPGYSKKKLIEFMLAHKYVYIPYTFGIDLSDLKNVSLEYELAGTAGKDSIPTWTRDGWAYFNEKDVIHEIEKYNNDDSESTVQVFSGGKTDKIKEDGYVETKTMPIVGYLVVDTRALVKYVSKIWLGLIDHTNFILYSTGLVVEVDSVKKVKFDKKRFQAYFDSLKESNKAVTESYHSIFMDDEDVTSANERLIDKILAPGIAINRWVQMKFNGKGVVEYILKNRGKEVFVICGNNDTIKPGDGVTCKCVDAPEIKSKIVYVTRSKSRAVTLAKSLNKQHPGLVRNIAIVESTSLLPYINNAIIDKDVDQKMCNEFAFTVDCKVNVHSVFSLAKSATEGFIEDDDTLSNEGFITPGFLMKEENPFGDYENVMGINRRQIPYEIRQILDISSCLDINPDPSIQNPNIYSIPADSIVRYADLSLRKNAKDMEITTEQFHSTMAEMETKLKELTLEEEKFHKLKELVPSIEQYGMTKATMKMVNAIEGYNVFNPDITIHNQEMALEGFSDLLSRAVGFITQRQIVIIGMVLTILAFIIKLLRNMRNSKPPASSGEKFTLSGQPDIVTKGMRSSISSNADVVLPEFQDIATEDDKKKLNKVRDSVIDYIVTFSELPYLYSLMVLLNTRDDPTMGIPAIKADAKNTTELVEQLSSSYRDVLAGITLIYDKRYDALSRLKDTINGSYTLSDDKMDENTTMKFSRSDSDTVYNLRARVIKDLIALKADMQLAVTNMQTAICKSYPSLVIPYGSSAPALEKCINIDKDFWNLKLPEKRQDIENISERVKSSKFSINDGDDGKFPNPALALCDKRVNITHEYAQQLSGLEKEFLAMETKFFQMRANLERRTNTTRDELENIKLPFNYDDPSLVIWPIGATDNALLTYTNVTKTILAGNILTSFTNTIQYYSKYCQVYGNMFTKFNEVSVRKERVDSEIKAARLALLKMYKAIYPTMNGSHGGKLSKHITKIMEEWLCLSTTGEEFSIDLVRLHRAHHVLTDDIKIQRVKK